MKPASLPCHILSEEGTNAKADTISGFKERRWNVIHPCTLRDFEFGAILPQLAIGTVP